MWQRRRLLIWGTTYPEFSKSYYETVCTGAIDGETGNLVRIYPVQLRYMAEPFSHFSWIEAEIERNTSDFRPESYRIRQESIVVGETIGTSKKEWAMRREAVLRAGNVFTSVEALREAEARDHTSLGLIRPREIRRVYLQKKDESERAEWEEQRERALKQRELFVDAETKTKELRFMPVQYKAQFRCDDPSCSTEHDCAILDWGVYVLSRKQYAKGGAEIAKRDVIQKITDLMDPTKRDPYFFMGNTKAHPQNFMIVGLFHPPKLGSRSSKAAASSSSRTLSLFDRE